MAVSAAYAESRRARLLAVRLQSKAQAALARQRFVEAKRREEAQLASQRAFEAEVEETKHAQTLARQLAQAEAQLGEAQRNAAHEAETKLLRQEQAETRRKMMDANVAARFDQALSKVQQRSAAARAAKEERAALKEASKQAERLVRAQIERAAHKAANQTPKHLLEYQRMTSPSYTPATPAAALSPRNQPSPSLATASMHVAGRATVRARGSIPGGLSPATPTSVASTPAVHSAAMAASAAFASLEDDESPALPLAVPTPHPHPSSVRKHAFNVKLQPTPATPKVAVALNFSSPAAQASAVQLQPLAEREAEDAEKKQQQSATIDPAVARAHAAADASKQAQLLVAHDRVLSNARLHRARGQGVTSSSSAAVASTANHRVRQEKAFEIVMKQGKDIVSERIGTEAPAATTTTTTTNNNNNNNRASSHKKQRPSSARGADVTTDRKLPNAAVPVRPASVRSASRTPRSASKSVTSTRTRAAKPVPILVPNAAFFAAQQQNLASAAAAAAVQSDLFNPQITVGSDNATGKKAMAWVIPLAAIGSGSRSAASEQSESSPPQRSEGQVTEDVQVQSSAALAPAAAPALRGLHLATQLEKQRNERMAAQEAALQLTASPAAVASAAAAAGSSALSAPVVEFGARYLAPQAAVSDQIIQQHEQELEQRAAAVPAFSPPRRAAASPSVNSSSEVFSSPLFPLASAAAAKVADAAAARTATPRAPLSQHARSAVAPAMDLDRQLRSILAQHLKQDATATQLIFSPQAGATTVGSQQHQPSFSAPRNAGLYGDDSDFSDSDDENDHVQPLASFTSPTGLGVSSALAYASSSASSTPSSPPFSRLAGASAGFTPCSPLTPLAASLVCSDPTSATDLFIEQIHFSIAQETRAKQEVDQIIEEARRQRTPAPAPAPAPAPKGSEGMEPQKENVQQQKIEATPNLLSPTAFLHQQHPSITPSSKQQQLQLLTPSQPLTSVPATPASAGAANTSFVPSSVDRKALLSAFSSLSADQLLAAKPTRAHNLFGSSIPATPSDASFMHTPMRSPQQPQQLLTTPPRRLQASFESMH